MAQTEPLSVRTNNLSNRLSEGEAAGLERGRSEGATQEKREIAKSMVKEGIAKEVIEKITGLSAEEVEEL